MNINQPSHTKPYRPPSSGRKNGPIPFPLLSALQRRSVNGPKGFVHTGRLGFGHMGRRPPGSVLSNPKRAGKEREILCHFMWYRQESTIFFWLVFSILILGYIRFLLIKNPPRLDCPEDIFLVRMGAYFTRTQVAETRSPVVDKGQDQSGHHLFLGQRDLRTCMIRSLDYIS